MRRRGRGICDGAGRFNEVEDGKRLGVGWTIDPTYGKILEQKIVWYAPLTHTE